MLECQRRAKKLYKLRHKDKINAQRRLRRREDRALKLRYRTCARCQGSLQYQKRSRRFCETCRTKYAKYLRYFWPKSTKPTLQHSNVPLNEIQKAVLERKKELWAIAHSE